MSHGSNKKGIRYNLLSRKVDLEDTSYLSKYFVLSDFNPTFTAGKNLFTINGSELLKKNSNILLEILDSQNNSLYYETAKSGYFGFAETTDLVISPHVYESTPSGFGKIILLGETVDNKVVRWSSNIKINPKLDNSTKVFLYDTPTISISEFRTFILKEEIAKNSQFLETLTGSIYSFSNSPKSFVDLNSVDIRKFDLDYRIRHSDTSSLDPNQLFDEQNLDNEIKLYISKISTLQNDDIIDIDVDITQSFIVNKIINNYEIQLNKPFTYNVNNKRLIVPIISASFETFYSNKNYITSSGLTKTDPDPEISGSPDPDVYFSQVINGENIFLKEQYLDIVYKNLKTLSGKIHRHKVYRRSLNKASDFECIADELLTETEILQDRSTINKSFSNLGVFYNLNHINNYYYTSSNLFELSHSSKDILNSMIFNSSHENLNENDYIILKNDSSLATVSSSKSSYVNYDEIENETKIGKSFDSNFIKLYKNTDYLFSSNVDIEKLNSELESKLIFYFTGSYNTSATIENNYVSGKGIKLYEYVLPKGVNYKSFRKEDFKLLNFYNDYIGTLVIVPVNISNFRMNDLSLKSHAEFGFSPDTFFSRISFPISIANEQYEIKVEFQDINSNSIYSNIRKIISVDKNGETLLKNIPQFLVADAESIVNLISSGSSLTISSSRSTPGNNDFTTDRAALSVVESFVVQDNDESGYPFFIVESGSIGGKRRMIFDAGSSNDSFAISGSIIIYTGSGYTDSKLHGTSSYSDNALSSSYSETSSLGYFISQHPQSDNFTASIFDETARSASGYIKTNILGVGDIFIPYYTSI